MFLLLAIIIIAVLLIYRAITSKPKSEVSEWEFWKVAPPIIIILPNGEKRFRHQERWSRYNNETQKWEIKKVIEPELLRFEEATNWDDVYNLRFL